MELAEAKTAKDSAEGSTSGELQGLSWLEDDMAPCEATMASGASLRDSGFFVASTSGRETMLEIEDVIKSQNQVAHLHDQNEFWEEDSGQGQKSEIKELEEQIRGYENAILGRAFVDSQNCESPNALQERPCISARPMLKGLQGQRRSLAQSINPDCPISNTIVLPLISPRVLLCKVAHTRAAVVVHKSLAAPRTCQCLFKDISAHALKGLDGRATLRVDLCCFHPQCKSSTESDSTPVGPISSADVEEFVTELDQVKKGARQHAAAAQGRAAPG
jgi:hypothetical protein